MNQNQFYQFYHSNALLVVNQKGLIRILFTPFRVLCNNATGSIPLNTWVYVDEVYSNNQDKLQYVINGLVYSFHHFTIPIQF